MKYIKTFENFHGNFQNENESDLNEGLLAWAKGVFGKVMDKFSSWKDKKAKEAAAKLAVVIEERSNEPKIQAKIKEIQTAFKALTDEEKKQYLSLQNEKEANEMAKNLDKAGIKELVKESIDALEGMTLNEALLTEGFKEILGKVLKGAGLAAAVITIIYMSVVFCTLVGSGYVASWALGAGLAAGHFAVIGCGVIAASGIVSATGSLMAGDAK
jgi:hypothetical protein